MQKILHAKDTTCKRYYMQKILHARKLDGDIQFGMGNSIFAIANKKCLEMTGRWLETENSLGTLDLAKGIRHLAIAKNRECLDMAGQWLKTENSMGILSLA